MPNFEFKKDCVCATAPNLALNSIVIVVADDRTQGFRPMVSSAVWGKAPAARKVHLWKLREKRQSTITNFVILTRNAWHSIRFLKE